MPSRFAAIDVGSNTLKLLIAERGEDGEFTPLLETARAARVGEGMAAGRLSEAAMERAVTALRRFAALCRKGGVEPGAIVAVATSAVRDAANRDEFLRRAADTGIPVEPIASAEEARLSYMAVARDPLWHAAERLLVVDIGGGSTEVILGDRAGVQCGASARMGAVRLTEAALHTDPPTGEEVERAAGLARTAISDALAELAPAQQGSAPLLANYGAATAVGVGGTVLNMARVALAGAGRDPDIAHGGTLDQKEVEAQVALFAARTVAERRAIAGLAPSRADIILGGAIVLRELMYAAGLPALAVSARGLRWGLLHDRFGSRMK